jgi:hypothetical protein
MKYAARKIDCQSAMVNLALAATMMPGITLDALDGDELDDQVATVFRYVKDPDQFRQAAAVLRSLADRAEFSM